MAGGTAVQVEERVDMPDGSATYWLSVKAPLLSDDGEVIGLVGSSIDVTARRQVEACTQCQCHQGCLHTSQKYKAVHAGSGFDSETVVPLARVPVSGQNRPLHLVHPIGL